MVILHKNIDKNLYILPIDKQKIVILYKKIKNIFLFLYIFLLDKAEAPCYNWRLAKEPYPPFQTPYGNFPWKMAPFQNTPRHPKIQPSPSPILSHLKVTNVLQI